MRMSVDNKFLTEYICKLDLMSLIKPAWAITVEIDCLATYESAGPAVGFKASCLIHSRFILNSSIEMTQKLSLSALLVISNSSVSFE